MKGVSFPAALTLVVLASTGCQTPTGSRTISPVAVSGLPLKLAHITSLNPDCSPAGDPVARVTNHPEHGVVTIRSGQGYSTFASGNPRHQCNFRATTGLNVVYVSSPGYVGPDSFAIDAFTGGQEFPLTFNVTVK